MAIFNLEGNVIAPNVFPQTDSIQLNQIGWFYGYINATTGGITFEDNRTCVCPQFIIAYKGTVISSANGYRFAVATYETPRVSGFVQRSSLDANSYTVEKDCYIRLHIAKSTSSSDPGIDDFVSAASNISCTKPVVILAKPFYKDITPAEDYTKVRDRFIAAMNEKAQQIGMTNSIFVDAAGYDVATNRVTARDMVRMGIEACAYDRLCRVWQTDSYTFKTLDPNRREIECVYGDDITALDSSYMLIGKKNGYMPLSGSNKSFTMVAVCIVNGKPVVGAIGILGTMSATDGRAQRVPAMKELMDNVKRIMDGGSAQTPTKYQYGCAAELPFGNVTSYERKSIPFIYAYQADTKFVPASCTKVLTAITMLDYITDVHERFAVLSSDDLSTGSGQLLQNGDVINYEQALYLMMLPSSGPVCRAIARTIGEKIVIAYD